MLCANRFFSGTFQVASAGPYLAVAVRRSRASHIFGCRTSETGGSMPRRACDEPLREEGKRIG